MAERRTVCEAGLRSDRRSSRLQFARPKCRQEIPRQERALPVPLRQAVFHEEHLPVAKCFSHLRSETLERETLPIGKEVADRAKLRLWPAPVVNAKVRSELNTRSVGAFGIVPPPALRKIIRHLPNSLGDPLDDARSPQRFEPANVRFHEYRIILAVRIRLRLSPW